MSYEPNQHPRPFYKPRGRRSIRLNGYDYTQAGAYFVTMVTHGHETLFGEIQAGVMQLNEFGDLAESEWQRLEQRFDRVIPDEFIVMPNHVHGILFIIESDTVVGAGQETDRKNGLNPLAPPLRNASTPNTRQSLGIFIGAYKSTTARLINGLRHAYGTPVWQRNYYERIIRDERELNTIRKYIRDNPLKWEYDQENIQDK